MGEVESGRGERRRVAMALLCMFYAECLALQTRAPPAVREEAPQHQAVQHLMCCPVYQPPPFLGHRHYLSAFNQAEQTDLIRQEPMMFRDESEVGSPLTHQTMPAPGALLAKLLDF